MSPSSWFKDFMAAAGVELSAGKPPHKAPLGSPMTLANMRRNGVRSLSARCLNPRCYHQAEFDADRYPETFPVKSFERRMV